MPMDYSKYAPDWKEISQRIRARDGQKCKQCGAANKDYIHRCPDNPDDFVVVATQEEIDEKPFHAYDQIEGYKMHGFKVTKVVLTVAHLDHDSTNNAESNLAALCQRCHLRLDAHQHKTNAARTRLEKKVKAGQTVLF